MRLERVALASRSPSSCHALSGVLGEWLCVSRSPGLAYVAPWPLRADCVDVGGDAAKLSNSLLNSRGCGLVRITRAIDFSASLRYARAELADEENAALFGSRARHHGHNYRLEVTLRGEPDPITGMVLNLKDLQQILDDEIMARFDHRDLNLDTPYFEKDPPSPENFARVIRRILIAALPDGLLDRIRLQQDADLWVDVVEPEP